MRDSQSKMTYSNIINKHRISKIEKCGFILLNRFGVFTLFEVFLSF